MPDDDKIPRVALRFMTGAQMSIGRALIVQSKDGRYWAYPEDSDLQATPEQVGAYLLDPKLLELVEERGDDAALYTYRATIHVLQ